MQQEAESQQGQTPLSNYETATRPSRTKRSLLEFPIPIATGDGLFRRQKNLVIEMFAPNAAECKAGTAIEFWIPGTNIDHRLMLLIINTLEQYPNRALKGGLIFTPQVYGDRIHAIRENQGITTRRLATALNVSEQTISNFEDPGHSASPTLNQAIEIARVLRISVGILIANETATHTVIKGTITNPRQSAAPVVVENVDRTTGGNSPQTGFEEAFDAAHRLIEGSISDGMAGYVRATEQQIEALREQMEQERGEHYRNFLAVQRQFETLVDEMTRDREAISEALAQQIYTTGKQIRDLRDQVREDQRQEIESRTVLIIEIIELTEELIGYSTPEEQGTRNPVQRLIDLEAAILDIIQKSTSQSEEEAESIRHLVCIQGLINPLIQVLDGSQDHLEKKEVTRLLTFLAKRHKTFTKQIESTGDSETIRQEMETIVALGNTFYSLIEE